MQYKKEPIAIVGLSSLFPEADNLQQFWRNIFHAKDAISDVPETHWKIEDYYDPNPNAEDKTYCKKGGFIPKTAFSPVEFGIPPNALDVIDVLQLLSLNVAKSVLFDAGYLENKRAMAITERTGVVLGITGANSLTQPLSNRLQSPKIRAVLEARGLNNEQIEDVIKSLKSAYAPWEENSFPGMLGNVVAGRVANRFDFGGINCTVDAACASSLAALRMAIDELHSGRADMMITGGCDAENTILMYMCFSKTPAFSKRGIISPFDAASDGTLIGEGIGMLALKRLSDAERDGDKIYSVITGLGASSDGKFKSIYAPRKEGQVKCLNRAYEDAGATINSVGLIEAHGTGTKVGDATEISALHETIQQNAGGSIAIGSVKSQIGHTKAAAGAAGLIKTALSLHHKVLPPTININKPADPFNGEERRLYVNNQARPWLLNNGADVRRAGVSSFGFGGTNFHAVLEEYTGENRCNRRLHSNSKPIVVTADSIPALTAKLKDIKQCEQLSELPFQTDQSNAVKLGFCANSINAARQLIDIALEFITKQPNDKAWSHPKGIFFSPVTPRGKVAALFSGQGSQYVNMGQSAAMHYPAYIDLLTHADKKMQQSSGEFLSDKIYPAPSYDDATTAALQQKLMQTRYAQPAIGVQSAAAYRTLQQAGFNADFVAGHSFGELTSLWAAEVISDDDYLTLAIARGAAMSPTNDQSESGTMAAVAASGENVKSLITDNALKDVYLCNFNTPSQTVIGGTEQGVNAFIEHAQQAGWQVKPLPVSAAFHTPLVAHAQSIFAENIEQISFAEPTKAVYRNKDGKAERDANALKSGLKQHILEPVCFIEQIKQMYQDGVTTFVEFGPKGHLSKMVAEILKEEQVPVNIIAIDNGNPFDSANQIMRSVVQLAVAGVDIQSLEQFEPDYQDAPQRPGYSIDMYGVNYVSESRKKAWNDSLEQPDEAWFRTEKSNDQVSPESAPLMKQASQVASEGLPANVSQDSLSSINTTPAVATKPINQGMIMSKENNNKSSTNKHLQMLGDIQQSNASLHNTYLNNATSTSKQTIDLINRLNSEKAEHASLYAIAQQGLDIIADGQEHTSASHQQYLAQMSQIAASAFGSSTENYDQPPVAIEGVMERAIAGGKGEFSPTTTTPKHTETVEKSIEDKSFANTSMQNNQAQFVVEEVVNSDESSHSANADDVLKQLISIVAEKTGYPEDVLDPQMDIEADLGIDSIKRVEILGALQSSLPNQVEIKPEQAAELKTLADFARVLGQSNVEGRQPKAEVETEHEQKSTFNQTTTKQNTEVVAVDIESLLLRVVSEKTGYPQEVLELQMDMEADLGIDSIKRVEILGDMQANLPSDVKLDPHALAEARSLEDIIRLSTQQLNEQPVNNDAVNVGSFAEQSNTTPIEAKQTIERRESVVEQSNIDIAAIFLQIVADKTGYPAEVLELSMRLEADLGIDSIKRVEILGELQNQLPSGIEHDPAALSELDTLSDIIEFISNKSSVAQTANVMSEKIVASVAPTSIFKHKVLLREISAPTEYLSCFKENPHALLVVSGEAQSQAIKSALEQSSFNVSTISLPNNDVAFEHNHHHLDNWNEKSLMQVLTGLAEVDVVIFPMVSMEQHFTDFSLEHQNVRVLKHLLLMAKHFKVAMDKPSKHRKAFITLTNTDGQLGLSQMTEDFVTSGGFGLIKTLAMETQHLFCRAIDASSDMNEQLVAEKLIAELFDSNVHLTDVGLKADQRFTFDIEVDDSPAQPVSFTNDTCFIVTGGAKGITASCIKGLARKQSGNYLLIGRSQLDEKDPDWAVGISDSELKVHASQAIKQQGEKVSPKKINALVQTVLSSREIRENLSELSDLGVNAKYVAVDLADVNAVKSWAENEQWLKESPALALIHGAGALADKLIEKKQIQELHSVFNAKLVGLSNILANLDIKKLVYSCHFSSVAGLFGNIGQVDYAMANEILNRMTLRLQSVMPEHGRTSSIIWGAWNAGMVTPQIKKMFEARGVALIEVEEGVEHFVDTCLSSQQSPLAMVGPSSGLSTRTTDFKEFEGFSAEIQLHTQQLANSGVLADHAIDGKVVMPLAFAMGWAARNIEHIFNQAVVVGCERMHVNSGIVMDESMPEALMLKISVEHVASSQNMTIAASIIDKHSPKVYYTFENIAVDQSILQQQQHAIDVAVEIDAGQLYAEKTLFHKDEFQLLRSYNNPTEAEMLFTCQWQPKQRHHLIAQHTSKVFCPMYADALLQAALVWVRKKEGLASLPMKMEKLGLHKPIASGEKLYIRVGEISRTESGSLLSLVALREDGQVHLVMQVSVVKSETLVNKFAAS